jgi:hypothetical protein
MLSIAMSRSRWVRPLLGSRWEIGDGESTIATLDCDEVRVSLLWKAITFVDERVAFVHDEHEDDLDLDTVVSIFAADLARREVAFVEPDDPRADAQCAKTLTSVYLGCRAKTSKVAASLSGLN